MVRFSTEDPDRMVELVRVIASGGVACIPTDTAYGLAVDPANPAAVERLFEIKGRDEGKPILLLVDSLEMAESVGRGSPEFSTIAGRFWPGPITLVITARETLSTRITAGTGTVGVRWPAAEFPLRLLRECRHPVTATSANRSGRPIARTADEAIEELGSALDVVVDAGPLTHEATSTVLDLTADPPEILREGPVRFDEISVVLGGGLRRRTA